MNVMESRYLFSLMIRSDLNLTTTSEFNLSILVRSIRSPRSFSMLPPVIKAISRSCSGLRGEISTMIVGFQPYPKLKMKRIVLLFGRSYVIGSTISAFKFTKRRAIDSWLANYSGVNWESLIVVGMRVRPANTCYLPKLSSSKWGT